jgi:hypothetical protein
LAANAAREVRSEGERELLLLTIRQRALYNFAFSFHLITQNLFCNVEINLQFVKLQPPQGCEWLNV